MPWDTFGYIHSTETKEKISRTMREKKINRGVSNPMSREVVQLTLDNKFIRKWDYIKEASKVVANVDNPSLISAVCRGAKNSKNCRYKSAYGYKWMYLDEYLDLYGDLPEAN